MNSDKLQIEIQHQNDDNGFAESYNEWKGLPGDPIPAHSSEFTALQSPTTATAAETQSVGSLDNLTPSPTSGEAKSNKNWTFTLSITYALLVVTLKVVIYISGSSYTVILAPLYTLGLLLIGFGYMLYLIIDANRYKRKTQTDANISGIGVEERASNDMELVHLRKKDSEGHFISPPAHLPSYQFSQGSHSGTVYLKLGATVFATGHLIHSVLLICVQLQYYLDDDVDNDDCSNKVGAAHDILNPLFCFLQLYFIFNYSNIVILKNKGLATFGFMHLIASTICFWMSFIIRETRLALTIYAHSKHGNNLTVKYQHGLVDLEQLYFNSMHCSDSPTSIVIEKDLSPYLFPFGVEFHILIVAFYYVIWSKIGQEIKEEVTVTVLGHDTASRSGGAGHDTPAEVVININCHTSGKGLFCGLIFVVFCVANLILGFVFGNLGGPFLEHGYNMNSYMKLCMHFLMIIAMIIAIKQTRSLDVNEHPISPLDDVFLYICLPAVFLETFLTLVATINILNIVRSIDVVLMTLQIIIQTSFLIDGLRRCSNSRRLLRQKPGRDTVIFLLIANVCLWVFDTFSYKSPESIDERYEHYGKVVWTILGHITLPLIMFYRFHSSVCFADIWDSAYKPATNHQTIHT